MSKSGTHYSDDDAKFLDWVANKIDTKTEMYSIAPIIAKIMDRTVSGFCNQIERRKTDEGHKEFYWAKLE